MTQPNCERQTIAAEGGTLEMLTFTMLPMHDSNWGLCTGVDGKIYIGICGEHTGGLSVFIASYDPATEEVTYHVECGPAIGEPPDNGRATQSKIHYCMVPGADGRIYNATHASGAPLDDPVWWPMNSWDDPKRCFTGSYLFALDPQTNDIHNYGVGPRREGSRATAFDEERRKIYGITWPRNHFYVFYLDTGEYRDIGRFGDTNPQAVWLDRDGHAYTTDDYGYILRCNPDSDELVKLSVRCPHVSYRHGWHNVPYDVVPAPDWSSVYGCDYGYESFLWRYDPYAGSEGRMDSFGRAFGPPDWRTDRSLEAHNVRGLVFGADGKLYYTMSARWEDPQTKCLLRFDPETQEREVVAPMRFGEREPVAIASATPDFYGNLYFAGAGVAPTEIYIYRPDHVNKDEKLFSWKDVKQWG